MKKRLRDIADFRVGYHFRGRVKHDPAGTVRVIQIKDIDINRQIRVADLVTVKMERPEPYLTQAGDVLFLSRGHRLHAVVVPEVEPLAVATGYFFILRPKTSVVLPEYLAWSLNQADFQESLQPYLQGSHMPMISRGDAECLRISLPTLDVQQQVLKLNELLNDERRLLVAIQKKRNLLVQAISRKLTQRRTGNEGD